MVSQKAAWKDIASQLPGRIGESVRERYVNHLDPSLKKSKWTKEEDEILFQNQRILGNKWSKIRKFLPGRSDNAIKNRYHNGKHSFLRRLKKYESKNNKGSVGKAAVNLKSHADVDIKNVTKRPTSLSLGNFDETVVEI